MSMPVSQEIAKIFEAIDTDFNGYITRSELEAYVKKTGQPESMVDVRFLLLPFIYLYVYRTGLDGSILEIPAE